MAAPFDRIGLIESAPSACLVPVPADHRPAGLTYEPFYGLREKPFSLTSDSRFFYQSHSHAPAFDDLLNAIRRRESLNALTGDIGTGKTTLCRAVLESLDRKTFSAFVRDPFASREELLKVLLTDFAVASTEDVTSGRLRGATRTELSYLLHEFLATLAPLQAFAVVIIDEAQNLSPQLLEEVRILSDADGLLQVVLVGQLELRDQLKRPEMRQIDQRVSVHCQLQPLDVAGVAGYISHRLHVVGGSSDRVRFTGDAIEAIYVRSAGVPRVINRLCDRALHHGYSRRAAVIDAGIVALAEPAPAPGWPAAVPSATATRTVPAPEATPAADAIDALTEPAIAAAPETPVPPPVEARTAATDAAVPSASEPASLASASGATSPSTELPEQLESWLKEIEQQPPLDQDWRQRWAPTAAGAPPPAPERRSGLRLRIPAGSNPYRHTHADRMRRRWTRRFVGSAVALILLLSAIIAGPAAVAASIDIWFSVEEQVAPPPYPVLPVSPPRFAGAPARVTPPSDPFGLI
jgi:type II secretory pathway predicted ATPase ExeA